uniref:PD-(D/E)XK nuclease-like domain-containing protein n=1 Tax=Mycobacterium tuberculosis TaxID=1773 RepID=UPI00214D8663
DYKTSMTANPAELKTKFYKLGYFMQAAWYIDLLVALGLAENPRFRFITQEKEPPYVVTPIQYDDEAIEEGRRRNRQAIRLYADCMESGKWPDYSDDVVTISLSSWELPRPQTVGDVVADSYIYDTDPLEEADPIEGDYIYG